MSTPDAHLMLLHFENAERGRRQERAAANGLAARGRARRPRRRRGRALLWRRPGSSPSGALVDRTT